MSKKIYKYLLDVKAEQIINIPLKQILTVQVQYGDPKLWAIIDEDIPTVPVKIYTFGTGLSLPENELAYIGTYQKVGGNLVFHVFYELIN